MRFLIIVLSALFLETGWLYAEKLDKVIVQVENVYTNATANHGKTTKFDGYIERIDIFYANSTSTCNLTLTSSNEYTGALTRLYTSGRVAASKTLYPGLNRNTTSGGVDVTNNLARYVMLGERIHAVVTNAVYSNQTVNCVVFHAKP